MTIKQFAEEIIRITGTKSQIEYKPLPVDDPKVRQPDIRRARKVLSWEPRVDFGEGVVVQCVDFLGGRRARGKGGKGGGGRPAPEQSPFLDFSDLGWRNAAELWNPCG